MMDPTPCTKCTSTSPPIHPPLPQPANRTSPPRFMDLSEAEVGYFITQVAMSAASFGVASSDLTIVGKALFSTFGYKDSAPAIVVPSQPAALQAICIGDGCPTASNATTSGYSSVAEPSTAVSSLVPSLSSATGSATPAMTGTATATSTDSGSASKTSSAKGSGSASATTTSTGGAGALGVNIAVLAGGLAAMIL